MDGEKEIPVTYFNLENNIFYVASFPRDPKMGTSDEAILNGQADGILARFKKFEVQREFFTRNEVRGLRLLLTRPDSYKIIELYVTDRSLYQVVTDLPSANSHVKESRRFRESFEILR